jgi:HlyD family secretion protein
VVVAVSNPDLKLFPGMTANVKIQVDHREDSLRVPNSALRFRPADTKTAQPAAAGRRNGRGAAAETVWVLGPGGKPQPAQVKLGISDGTYSEVVSGNLATGQEVITGTAQISQANPALGGGAGPRRGMGF